MSEAHTRRGDVVKAFCECCIWARTVRVHFSALFETSQRQLELLEEVAAFFFSDLNKILIDYILLQLCKLTDPSSSGVGKENLTSNYILCLDWSPRTVEGLNGKNAELLAFRLKIDDARKKLIAHSDLKTHLGDISLGCFSENEERAFWEALQAFVDLAHSEAIGGPFPIEVTMQGGDVWSLVHVLKDGVDYDDMISEDAEFYSKRLKLRRYEDV